MMKLIRFLITGSWHEHVWETFKEEDMYSDGDYEHAEYTRYTMKCKGCGSMKRKEL